MLKIHLLKLQRNPLDVNTADGGFENQAGCAVGTLESERWHEQPR
jgi:hypothetical protein